MTELTKNIRIVFTYFGRGLAVGAYGPKEDVTQFFNKLHNFAGHKDDITFLSDGFGYVLTTKQTLLFGFKNWFKQPAFETVKDWERGLKRATFLFDEVTKSNKAATEFVESISLENFLNPNNALSKQYENIV